jgi:HlyD family secretion protein
MNLEREAAQIDGQIGRLTAEIAELEGQITNNALSELQLRTARQEEARTAERDLQFSKIELSERRVELLDRLARTELRAPVGGIIYESQVFAEQAVVTAAEPIMYIIPQDQPLIVSARINSIDIDAIHVGQDVSMRFEAFDQKGRQPAPGTVVRVSADAITDRATGAQYYAVDIRPSPAALETLRAGEELLPGMPVQAFIRTRDRTAFAYLAEPLTAFLENSFRE